MCRLSFRGVLEFFFLEHTTQTEDRRKAGIFPPHTATTTAAKIVPHYNSSKYFTSSEFFPKTRAQSGTSSVVNVYQVQYVAPDHQVNIHTCKHHTC